MKRVTENPVYTVRRSFPKGKKPYYVPLYGGLVYLCTDKDDFAQVYDYMTSSDQGYAMTEGCLGCVCPLSNEDGCAAYVIGVFDAGLNTFVHELSHLAIEVLDRAGCPIDNHTSEAFCYLIGSLAEHFEPQFVEVQKKAAEELKKENARDARAKKREEAAKLRAEQDRLDEVFKNKDKADEAPVKPLKGSKGKGGDRDRS